ncbi:MAG: O-antigen ligase family protein [Fimbriiglobus sp.]|jgi:probable O-glycosylation ligase (exosortase A-associated)|nr:O-antigen ligase family protein [Fimbriiglobus sp.]
MEKQTIFMIFVTGSAVLGSLAWGPYIGILVYYAFAVLRPQHMWQYSLPQGMQWSLYVGMAAIIAGAVYRLRLIGYPTAGPTPGTRPALWNIVHWAMMGFFGWMTLCFIRAENQDRAWLTFDIYLKTTVMFVVAALSVYRLSQMWVLLVLLVGVDVYVAYEANFQYFVWRWNQIQLRGFGGLDNNGAALMLAMAIPLCYFLWEGTTGWWRWGYLAVVPVIAHAVQLTFSRGSMVATLMAMPVVFLFSRHKRLLLVLAVLGAAFVLRTSGPELQDRFFSIKQHDLDESANMRKMAWRAAAEIATERPFFGVGLRCSAPHMKAHGAPEGMTIHSQYLQLAADSGWVGMFSYMVLYIGALVLGVRLWWQTRTWPDYPEVRQARAMAAGIVSSLVLYGIGAFFLSLETFELPYILFLIIAQLWNCYKGGGIEAAVRANGSALPPPPAPLIARPQPRRPAPMPPPPMSVLREEDNTPVIPLQPARPQ